MIDSDTSKPQTSNTDEPPTKKFILDRNLELPVQQKPWSEMLSKAGISTEVTTDLVHIDTLLADDGPDIAYVPGADFCKMNLLGNAHYRGVLIATSKFTGESRQTTLLVVRKDDEANSIDDLAGAEYGYMNRSCSSSYFPPAILTNRRGKNVGDFFKMREVGGWQARVDAVVAKKIRATMILDDVWKMTPANFENAKIIGRFDGCPPAVLAVSTKLASALVDMLTEHLLAWTPEWHDVYGAFRPYYNADVSPFEHYMSELPYEVL